MDRRTILKSLAAVALAPVSAIKAAIAPHPSGKVIHVTISEAFTALVPVQDWVDITWDLDSGRGHQLVCYSLDDMNRWSETTSRNL